MGNLGFIALGILIIHKYADKNSRYTKIKVATASAVSMYNITALHAAISNTSSVGSMQLGIFCTLVNYVVVYCFIAGWGR